VANLRDALLAVAIVLAAVVVWWLLAVALDWLRDWLQALNIRKQLHTGKHVSPGGEPLPVLGGQQRPSWWRRVTGDQWDGLDDDGQDITDIFDGDEGAPRWPTAAAPVSEWKLADRIMSDCCQTCAWQVPAGGWACEGCGNGCVPLDVPRPGTDAKRPGPGYFHDDVPTDVVPAVQLTDGTYVGLKGTIPANLPRPGSPPDGGWAGPGQPDDTRFDITPYPRAGRPIWAPPPPRHPAWVQRILDAPISEVRRALAAPDPDMYLWGWQQRKALETA
jgi:hypothetical protein